MTACSTMYLYKIYFSNFCFAEFSGYKQNREEDELSIATDYQDFDPAKHNPVFYGKMHSKITTDNDPQLDVDVATIHPSVIGYAFTEKPVKSPSPPPTPIPAKEKCKINFMSFFWRNCN